MLASSGYVCQIDPDLCLLCGDCTDVCQFGALKMGELHALIDQDVCMGCGVCTTHCTQGALELVRAVEKGEPLEIMDLIQKMG
jgi:MinD superfamily P-loop ATPase